MKGLLAVLALVPAAAFAASSSFDGTWKMKLDSFKVSGKPDAYVLADGTYSCTSCDPAYKVAADGAPHPVTGASYYDSVAVKVVNPNTVEITRYRGGKAFAHVTETVSADGKSYTGKFVNHDGTKEMTGTFTEKRVSGGPAGAHAISGEWMQDALPAANDAATTVAFEMTGDHFKMSSNGQTYDAQFDGKEYPIKGDPGHTMVTLKRLSANTVEETDQRQGKVTDVIRMATAADGKSLKVEDKDMVHGQTSTWTMEKQQ